MAHARQELALEFCGLFNLAIAKLQLPVGRSKAVHEFRFFSFVVLLLADINSHNYFSRAAGKIQPIGGDLDVDDGTILKSMLPIAYVFTSFSHMIYARQ